jgi:CheY-like chemotaxis protein
VRTAASSLWGCREAVTQPDVILLDLRMPQNGVGFLYRLRADRASAHARRDHHRRFVHRRPVMTELNALHARYGSADLDRRSSR